MSMDEVKVVVDAMGGDDAPGVREAEFLDNGLHQFVLSMRSWSEATPGSVPSSVKPKCL